MSIKKIMIFGVVGLVVLAGAGAAYYFLVLNKQGGQEASDSGHEESGSSEAPSSSTPPPAAQPPAASNDYDDDLPAGEEDETGIVVATQTHVINLPTASPGARGGFLKCVFAIFIRDAELGAQMTSETPTPQREEAKAIILEILSDMTAEEVLDSEIRITVRQDIMDRLNESFRPKPSADKKAPQRPRKPIKDVLITEWAVQR
ncbi:MAG: flagellar basal body-associated FliL family protein [Holophagales bacterium]|jgi:flagellar basal body-associated protein FliL|nr:flagellar basal body-associated FliL family protein [Holophagales bacterium]